MVVRIRVSIAWARRACPTIVLALAVSGAAFAQRGGRAAASVPKTSVQAAAREIDRLVRADLARNEASPNRRTDDATFVRRAYLAIVGRIPTADETRAFLDSKRHDERGQLIDALLASPGRASHEFNYWADLLRAKTRLARQTSGEPYLHFIKQSIADNVPYDEFVRQLLVADGPAHAEGHGATGYYLRDRGMPEDNMANTVRVFLGTRLECAQCHNHPFDRWTQKDFFSMVAFTGGLRYQNAGQHGREFATLYRDVRKEKGANGARALRNIVRTVTSGVGGDGAGLVRLPDDYQYEDAKPKQVIVAETLFGPDVDVGATIPRERPARGRRNRARARNRNRTEFADIGSRAAYADWLTSAENPRFTTVIANRMWKRAMGLGLIEPVDNISESTVASNPELLTFLEELMVELDYDLVQFQRVLLHSDTWQRVASPAEPNPDERYLFAGPVLRRMSAEQLWDSMLSLVVADLDDHLQPPDAKAKAVYSRYEEFVGRSRDELMVYVDREMVRYTDPDEYRARRAREMRKRRGDQESARKETQARFRELAGKARELRRAIARARRQRDRDEVAALEKRLAEVRDEIEQRRSQARKRARRTTLARASDLPSPAPPGHFLRQFGQSDREQIEAANTDANVPQALALINGFVEEKILGARDAVLTRALADAGGAAERIEVAFLSILNREPTSQELTLWRKDMKQDPEQAVRDLVWTLVNCHEFRFVR